MYCHILKLSHILYECPSIFWAFIFLWRCLNMTYDLNKYSISYLDLIFSGVQEVPIDSDITLPDYCPDIGKILKCQVSASVLSRNISGDRLAVEGVSFIELLYSDVDKNIIRCFKTEIPFSQNFSINSSSNPEVATFNVKREYINCRAVSPRKIDVHGAFSLRASVFGKKNIDVTNDIVGEDIKLRKHDVSFSQLNSILQHQFNINETLDLGSDKPSPEFIVKSNLNINDLDCSCENDQINFSCKLNVKILYVDDIETGELNSVEYNIPVNETIDAQGVMDDNICKIIPEIVSHEERISSDSESPSNLINEDIKLMITCFTFQNDEISVISDAYSTEYNVELSNENISLNKFSKILCENVFHEETCDILTSKIIDIWTDSSLVTFSNDSLNSKVNICVLALDSDFVPFYFERELQFSTKLDSDISSQDLSKSQFFLSVQKIDYKILNKNSVELKLKAQIFYNLCSTENVKVVSEVYSDDSCKREKDSNTSLIIYYADAGEDLWDIAKKYCTTVDKIKDENEFDFDVLDSNRVILIPTV